ncbi:MAG: hypothetical protein PVJ34_01885 [Anaerolineae bacterium]|jgi:hypothetical protein
MRKSKLARWAGREARAILKLSPWIAVALFLVAAFWGSDTAALSGLFQSPPTLTPTVSATDTPEATATLPPTEVPAETPTLPPTETPLPPTATVTDTPLPAATEADLAPPGDETPGVEGTPGQEGDQDDRQRYAEGESDLKFEWPMLFDSVALGLSYAWLCCGVLILVGIPLIFIVLWVASRSRRGTEE